MTKKHPFTKQERLSSAIQIDHLFQSGNVFSIHPLKVFYIVFENPELLPVKILIAISKKRFKKAVDRNRIRRKIREAYRLNKSILYNELLSSKSGMILGVVYTAEDADPDFHVIENKMIRCLERLSKLTASLKTTGSY